MNEKQIWNIYHGDAEYGRSLGDPVLSKVEATTKQEAEKIAEKKGISSLGGLHAAPAKEVEKSREGLSRHATKLREKNIELGDDFGY